MDLLSFPKWFVTFRQYKAHENGATKKFKVSVNDEVLVYMYVDPTFSSASLAYTK
jgi:hypothetical protein